MTNINRQDSVKGVSTRCAYTTNNTESNKQKEICQWYVMRTTYGRERRAYEFIIAHGGIAFYPTILRKKIINNQIVTIRESRLPNLFFFYGTEEAAQSFVYDNVNLPFLRFYYSYNGQGTNLKKRPLIIPNKQMDSLRILCSSEDSDILVVPEKVKKFEEGQKVKVVEGQFKGVEGKVARWHGQQRVAIIIDGLCTMATAYVPSSFIEKILDG